MRYYILYACLIAVATAAPQYSFGAQDSRPKASRRGGDKYLPPATTSQPPHVHKQFYAISAPEDTENIGRTKHLVIGRPQKNYRVVFIKAPSSELSNVKLSAEYAPQEEKTVIYVLTKKDHDLTADDIATPEPTAPSKPEVFFIKYNSPEEASAVQKEIEGQYDTLGGTKEINDEESAPIASVIGSLDGASPNGGYDYQQVQGGDGSSAVSQFLPPTLIK